MNTINNRSPRTEAHTRQVDTNRARRIAEEVAVAAKVPGMTVAVASPDEVLYADAIGYADLTEHRRASIEDQYPWFSMTKIATATAAVRLHADGLLDLDTPIDTYLPTYRPHPRHGSPTTRQLLSHTAGLGNPLPIRWVRPEGDPEDPTLVTRILDKFGSAKRPIGTRAAYSNIGYLLAGAVMEAVTGRSVQDCVRRAVLDPLGMHQTGYSFQARRPRSVGHIRIPSAFVPLLRKALPAGLVGARIDGHTTLRPFLLSGAAYGGLVGSVTDAVRLAAAHAANASDAHPILNQDDIESMRTIRATGKPFDHGIGWFRKPADTHRAPGFVEHYGTGVGYWNAMRIYPDQRLAMVAMTNTTFKWDVDRLFTGLQELSWH
jgi:CubicO group peptidase (beta-lactamase class C family)